jgi:hypothetical protein
MLRMYIKSELQSLSFLYVVSGCTSIVVVPGMRHCQ